MLIVLAGGVFWWMMDAMGLQSRDDLEALLSSRVSLSQEFIRNWAHERQRDVASMSASEEMRNSVAKLLDIPRTRNLLAASPEQARLNRLISPTMIGHGFLGFSIISPDLIYLSSSQDSRIGEVAFSDFQAELLISVFQGKPVNSFSLQEKSLHPNFDQTHLNVIGPILNEKGDVIAALAFRLDPVADLRGFIKLGHFGRSAETYIFDKRGRFLTESRFVSQLHKTGQLDKKQSSVILTEIRDPGGNLLGGFKPVLAQSQWPLTLAVENAIQGRSGVNLSGYRDYRGVPVVGAWVWISSLNFGLVSEIDVDEAYERFYSSRKLIVSISLLTVVLFIVFSAVLAKALKQALKSADEIQRSKIFLHTVLDTSVIAFIIIDRRGIIQSINKSAEQILGYPAQEIMGKNVSLLMPEPYSSQHDQYINSYLGSGHKKIIGIGREVLARHKDGTVFPINLSVSEVRIGEDITFIGAIQDISERKRMEVKLVKSHENLEFRVKKRTEELSLINEELKNFAYIVSHDLRSPLVNLKGFTSELGGYLKDIQSIFERVWLHVDASAKEKVMNIFEKDVPEAMGFINSSVNRMDNLINSVLKLSRLGRRVMDLQAVNTEALVNKVLKTLAYQIEQRHAQVMVGSLPEVIGDPIEIEQIFGNILSNAVNYLSPERNGMIHISAETGIDETTFHIQDNGNGIAQDDMEKIFEIFRRAGKQDVPGEGMGLAYVKTLVRRHGGRLWCDSEPGVGSTFSFTISKHFER